MGTSTNGPLIRWRISVSKTFRNFADLQLEDSIFSANFSPLNLPKYAKKITSKTALSVNFTFFFHIACRHHVLSGNSRCAHTHTRRSSGFWLYLYIVSSLALTD